MAKFTNEAAGLRGINLTDGTTLWVEPGATEEVDEKDVKHVHADLKKGEAAAKAAAKSGSEAGEA